MPDLNQLTAAILLNYQARINHSAILRYFLASTSVASTHLSIQKKTILTPSAQLSSSPSISVPARSSLLIGNLRQQITGRIMTRLLLSAALRAPSLPAYTVPEITERNPVVTIIHLPIAGFTQLLLPCLMKAILAAAPIWLLIISRSLVLL